VGIEDFASAAGCKYSGIIPGQDCVACRKRIAKPEDQVGVFLAESEISKSRGLRDGNDPGIACVSFRRRTKNSHRELISLLQVGDQVWHSDAGGEPGSAVQGEQAGI